MDTLKVLTQAFRLLIVCVVMEYYCIILYSTNDTVAYYTCMSEHFDEHGRARSSMG